MSDFKRAERTVPVSRLWYEQLESYLHSDERFTRGTQDGHVSFNNICLLTWDGKEIIFEVAE